MSAPETAKRSDQRAVPKPGLSGLVSNFRYDFASGFLVFLIALPLCLAIAKSSSFPPIAGVMTAVVGGLLTPWISNSELTIKGPAAGLIVIVSGAVVDLQAEFNRELVTERTALVKSIQESPNTTDAVGWKLRIKAIDEKLGADGYRLALGVGAAAAALQIIFGLCRGGILGDFFPTSAVHGLLASIGIIIISKEIHKVLGAPMTIDPKDPPIRFLAEIPHSIQNANWAIASIGLTGLLVMFGLPWIKNKVIKRIPAQLIVLLFAIPMGIYFNLSQTHDIPFLGGSHGVGPQYLVSVPLDLRQSFAFPDFRGIFTVVGAWWVLMFMLIGTLESMLSSKAIDLIDPWHRKTDLNRDLLAVGTANFCSAWIGGLPMISEIVRSSANTNNGARSRFANMYHGIFLLCFVALLPGLINHIPQAALSAMLCYTGYRLASPKEFFNVYRVGKEQLIIFVTTIVVTLSTDLLIGIAAGIGIKWIIHWINGMSISSMFSPSLEMADRDDGTHVVAVKNSIVFSNWITFRRRIAALKDADVELDLTEARLVDHTAMEKLHELQNEFAVDGRTIAIVGLDNHRPLSLHPAAARKRYVATV